MTGTWYPPSLGTGGVLIEAQLFTNPPFKMTEHDPTGRSAEGAQVIEPAQHTILAPVPVPVAVSERLPGPDDCDAEGKCWMGYWDSHANGLGHSHKTWFWTLEDLSMVDEHTHWLPAHALPLPSGEVEQ